MGIIITIAGSILAIGKDLIPLILSPVASIKIPPLALKSASISGVVIGIMTEAPKNKTINTTNWGIKMAETIYPNEAAKIVAAKMLIIGWCDHLSLSMQGTKRTSTACAKKHEYTNKFFHKLFRTFHIVVTWQHFFDQCIHSGCTPFNTLFELD